MTGGFTCLFDRGVSPSIGIDSAGSDGVVLRRTRSVSSTSKLARCGQANRRLSPHWAFSLAQVDQVGILDCVDCSFGDFGRARVGASFRSYYRGEDPLLSDARATGDHCRSAFQILLSRRST